MEYFEFSITEVSLQNYGYSFHHNIRENWKRYLDDFFIPLNKVINKLWDFKSILNGIIPNIPFTVEYRNEQLLFLDILIKKCQQASCY